MKKFTLLFLGASAFFGAVAQQVTNPNAVVRKASRKVVQDKTYSGPSNTNASKTRDPFQAGSSYGTKEAVGKTTYDLQTNGSMQRRVLQGPGNQLSCAWTFSSETGVTSTSTYADRGTGYAHFDGTAWTAQPTSRIESVRTGFGGIVRDGSGNENYIAHDAAANQLYISKKSGTTWTGNALSTANGNAPIWPHTATSGNWMYVVASPSDSNIHTNGIRNGYFFARSNDNGATWIDNMIPMPLIDSVGHYRGGGNSYAISANGNNVAILFGDMGTDLTLLKSTDNGATWTKKVVWDFPIDNFNFAASIPTDDPSNGVGVDTIFANDGSFSMALDANGDVHAAFPVLRVLKDGTSAGYSYFALTSRLVYYHGYAAGADSLVLVDDIFDGWHDCDQSGSVDFGDNYTGATGVPDAAYNSIGLITQPSISIVPGSPQKVLIAYSCVMDNDTTVDDGVHPYWFGSSSLEGQPYRDVLVVGSQDNGLSWTFPVNASRTAHFEEAFISTPELISGTKLPILCQADIEPGTIMQNEDIYEPEYANFQILQQVDIADIFTLGADTLSICNQVELPLGTSNILNSNDGLVTVFPSPASDVANIAMKFISGPANVNIEVIDIAGHVVFSKQMNNVREETCKVPVATFANGVYAVKINSDKGMITRKFVKE
ncbi:MAG: hypothetical protein RIQ62_449 [Bacteroidota bacterium]|jgi:hypothetical protein